MVYPLPAALVSCGVYDGGNDLSGCNFLTVAWTGTICTNPPMLYISVRPERYSHELISRTMEFTLNLTTADMARAVDWAGVKSGRDFNKWRETGLTAVKGVKVSSPSIEESPLSIECRVKEIMRLGSHDMFVADVLNVLADERYINPETNAFDLAAARLIAYSHGGYYPLEPQSKIGGFGFSVKKKK